MNRFLCLLISILVPNAFCPAAQAETKFPARVRLFAGVMPFKNEELNTVLQAENLKKIDIIPQLGVEIDVPLRGAFDWGMRYHKKVAAAFENGSNTMTENNAAIGQDVIQIVGRLGVANLGIARFDVFGAVGGANTVFEIKTPSQTGELKSSAADKAWVASFAGSYGASVSVGYKWVHFMLEAGMEHNTVDKFTRTGNVPNTIQKFDFTGPYAVIGFVIDGVQATKN